MVPAAWLRTLSFVTAGLLGAAVACDGEAGCSDGRPPNPAGDVATEQPPVDGGKRFVPPQPNKAKRVSVKVGAPFDLASGKARPGKILRSGSELWVGEASTDPARLLLGHSKQPDTGPERFELVDIDTGEGVAEVEEAREICPRAGVVRAWTGEGRAAALIRLDNGGLFRPNPRLPDGRGLENPIIVASPESSEVLVFAALPDGSGRYGVVQDLEVMEIVLDRESPVVPLSWRYNEGAASFEVSRGRGRPGKAGMGRGRCVRARTPVRGEPLCLAWGDPDDTGPGTNEHTWLDGDWVVEGLITAKILDATTGEKQLPTPMTCEANLAAALRSPPRAMFGCQVLEGKRSYFIWRPGAAVTFDIEGVNARTFNGTGLVANSVLPASVVDRDFETSEFWVDLKRGRLLETAPLEPLVDGSLARKDFAIRRDGRTIELHLLDFDALEQRLVARFDDCPGELRLLSRQEEPGERFVVGCMEQPSELYVFRLVWAEIIDLGQGKRWRSSALPEQILGDGRVIASDRAWVAAESHRTARKVFLLELL